MLERLQERLEAYEFLLKEKEAEHARKKEQELEAKLAREEEEKQAMKEMEEETREEDDDDEGNSNAGDLIGADGEDVEEEESSDESGEEEDEDDAEDSQAESDENLNKRRQRKAAQQANYSFKDFDDMIKSALRVKISSFNSFEESAIRLYLIRTKARKRKKKGAKERVKVRDPVSMTGVTWKMTRPDLHRVFVRQASATNESLRVTMTAT